MRINFWHESRLRKQEKNVHINTYRETFNLRIIAETIRDGTPAHISSAVRDVLSNTCHGRWISRGGHIPWPPRSPDFNPLGTPKNPCVCNSC
jgi:hypothetical protein